MKRHRYAAAFLPLLVSCSLWGEDLPKGRVVERVVCAGNERQSYALYLPPSYSPERKWPILYCLDPGARGKVPVERFAEAAERAGWIVVGSNNSRNGPTNVSHEAIQWMVNDTHGRLSIDDTRAYAAGFSGGAREALSWATNGRMAGVVACGAGFAGGTVPKGVSFRVYGTAGVDDFNFDEVYAMGRELSRRGVAQRFAEFPGGHDWLPAALTGAALEFLSGRAAAEPPPPASRLQKSTAERYASLQEEVMRSSGGVRRALLDRMRRDAGSDKDGVERRAARRALLGSFVSAMEQGRALLADKKYSEALPAWELAVAARPDNAEAYYQLAVSHAGARESPQALDALQQAVAKGFDDHGRVEREPAFERMRNDAKFAAALAKLMK